MFSSMTLCKKCACLRNIVIPPGKYLWYELLKSPQASSPSRKGGTTDTAQGFLQGYQGIQFQQAFSIIHDCVIENARAGEVFGKICLKAIRNIFLPLCGLRSREEQWGFNFLVGVISNRIWRFKILCLRGELPLLFQVPPLKGNPNLPIRKTLRTVFSLLTVMILKRVNQIIFFQGNKFTVCMVKNKKRRQNI